MKNILITGSVMNSDDDLLRIYNRLVNLCKDNNFEVLSPLDTMKFQGSDQERYKRAIDSVNSADFIIAEMSIPSTGQGMELQEAVINKKPVLIIAKEDSKISGLIKGSGSVVDILFYSEIDDLETDIIKIISSLK